VVKLLRRQMIFIFLSLILGSVVSDFTEEELSKPAADLINLVTSGYFGSHSFDEKGLPDVWYARLGRAYRNPVYVSVYGLYYFQKWSGRSDNHYFLKYYALEQSSSKKAGTKEYFEWFMNSADWLVENIRLRSLGEIEYGVWEYVFPLPIYELKPPWVSAMAQSLGVQVLVRAYAVSGERRYLEAAKHAIQAFYVEVKDGGVTYKDSDDEWWFEEYAHPLGRQSRVLNGMEHAVIGILEYYGATRDESGKALVERGLRSLRSQIDRYDAGWWTNYDALGRLANRKYHLLNIGLTTKLYDMTGETTFLLLSGKWAKYREGFLMRELLKQTPDYHDLVILGLNCGGVLLFLNVIAVSRRVAEAVGGNTK
jgi:hypothetical protein